MGENNCKQTVHAAQQQKNKQTNQKMDERPKQTFLQRRHTHGQHTHDAQHHSSLEKCKPKLQRGITSHQSEWPSLKNLSINNKYWKECGEKGTLLHCWWECKLIQPLWRTVQRFFKKNWEQNYHMTQMPPLGTYPEKAIIERDTCTPMFIAALFTIDRKQKQPRCPLTD